MPDCFLASKHNRNKALAVCVCACEPLCTSVTGCPRAGHWDAVGSGYKPHAERQRGEMCKQQEDNITPWPLTYTVTPVINLCLAYDSAMSKDCNGIVTDSSCPQLLMAH